MSGYDMQNARQNGIIDEHYDQVSPRTATATIATTNGNYVTQTGQGASSSKETKSGHTTSGTKDAKSSHTHGHKGAGGTNAAYDTYGNEMQASDAYGGKETLASDAAYGRNTAHNSNPVYSGNDGQGDYAAYGNGDGRASPAAGLSRNSTKTAKRGGHHVLHKDPPVHHPAAAMAGGY
jgi:hypothetical protein